MFAQYFPRFDLFGLTRDFSLRRSCSSDKWTTYAAVKIAGGCFNLGFVPGNGTGVFLKYDCALQSGGLCTDSECKNCNPSTSYDNSAWKTCTGITGNKYQKALYVIASGSVCGVHF